MLAHSDRLSSQGIRSQTGHGSSRNVADRIDSLPATYFQPAGGFTLAARVNQARNISTRGVRLPTIKGQSGVAPPGRMCRSCVIYRIQSRRPYCINCRTRNCNGVNQPPRQGLAVLVLVSLHGLNPVSGTAS
jgi:hypothetical protein